MTKLADYPFEIRPLSSEDGGGFLISFPDFAECISDGETVEEAIANGLFLLLLIFRQQLWLIIQFL